MNRMNKVWSGIALSVALLLAGTVPSSAYGTVKWSDTGSYCGNTYVGQSWFVPSTGISNATTHSGVVAVGFRSNSSGASSLTWVTSGPASISKSGTVLGGYHISKCPNSGLSSIHTT